MKSTNLWKRRWVGPSILVALAGLWLAPAAEASKMTALEGLVRAALEESRAELRGGARVVEKGQLIRGSEGPIPKLLKNLYHFFPFFV